MLPARKWDLFQDQRYVSHYAYKGEPTASQMHLTLARLTSTAPVPAHSLREERKAGGGNQSAAKIYSHSAAGDRAARSAGSISVWVNTSGMQLSPLRNVQLYCCIKKESGCPPAEQTETILILPDLYCKTNCLPSCILCWAVPLLTHFDVLSKQCGQDYGVELPPLDHTAAITLLGLDGSTHLSEVLLLGSSMRGGQMGISRGWFRLQASVQRVSVPIARNMLPTHPGETLFPKHLNKMPHVFC